MAVTGVYGSNVLGFQREVKSFDQKVDRFVRKYYSSVKTALESILSDIEKLNLQKSSLSKRCSLSKFSKADCIEIESQLLVSQKKITEALSRFCIANQLSNHPPEVKELFQVREFQDRCTQLTRETSTFLHSPEPDLTSQKARALQNEWSTFIEQITILNDRAGKYLFKKMDASPDRRKALENGKMVNYF